VTAQSESDRARGALYGLAIGDALGMPTQLLSPAEVDRRFGSIRWFQSPPDDHPIAAGMPAGHITDDTEQALLIARLLIEGRGHIDALVLAKSLAEWERDMARRGSLDLLGPSTQRAISAVAAGISVEEAGRFGDTNGAAMRVAPVGIAMPVDDFDGLLQAVVEASGVTHNTTIALAGAFAVAAAVSAGIAGASVEQAIAIGASAAQAGRSHGSWVAGADVAARIEAALAGVEGLAHDELVLFIRNVVGTSVATQESVPAAFAVLRSGGDGHAWDACLRAASLGGDSDTIAAIVGAIAGACQGVAGFPKDALDLVKAVNKLELEPMCDELLQLRQRHGPGASATAATN
jgi:ADP-ribosylglycohydrolase